MTIFGFDFYKQKSICILKSLQKHVSQSNGCLDQTLDHVDQSVNDSTTVRALLVLDRPTFV